MVTLDPTASTTKAIYIKNAKFGQKKRSTLGPQLLQTIMDSVGMECDGAIRAKSKTRNWYYVQPHQNDDTYNNNDGIQLLVGVSTP